MKIYVTGWVMDLTSQADMLGIKLKDLTISNKDYAQLLKELTWSSRVKPGEENVNEISIVAYGGTLRIKRDQT